MYCLMMRSPVVEVGGVDVGVGGTDVAAGGTDVAAGGADVEAGGADVAAGGADVAAGGADVEVGGSEPEHAMIIKTARDKAANNKIGLFVSNLITRPDMKLFETYPVEG